MVIKTRARSGADKLERRMQILETTLQLWGHTDYAKLTMSQVAAALNLAKGTLYLYFPSKEELFLAIYIQLPDRPGPGHAPRGDARGQARSHPAHALGRDFPGAERKRRSGAGVQGLDGQEIRAVW
jgi:AcrR family transcriptional regulator